MSFLDGLLGSPNVSQATNSSVSAATGASLFLTAPSVVRTKSGQFKLSSSVCANLAGSTSGGISIQFFSSLTGAIGPTATGVGVNGSAASSIVWIDSPSINVGQSITYSVEVSPTNASTSITLPNKASSIVVAEEGGAPSGSGVIAVSTSGGGGGGGGGALSSLASPFTMPAVGSTVISAMIPGGGAAFQKNNAVNVNVSGAPSNFTVTLVSGDNVTLLNNGGPFNVAPTGTVPAASIVTVASMNAPLLASTPGAGKALMLSKTGSYIPQGIQQVYSVWDPQFAGGAKGDGSTDDTAAIQAAINFMIANPTAGVLYFPPGIYIISSTINISLPLGQGFRMVGAGGLSEPFVSELRWKGASTGIMGILTGGFAFHMEHLAWIGNAFVSNQCSVAFQLLPSAVGGDNHKFDHCFFSAVSGDSTIQYRKANHAYSTTGTGGSNDVIAGPDAGLSYAARGLQSDNGHIYKCTTNGTTSTAPTLVAYDTTAGSFTTDGTAVFQEIGISPCGSLLGDAYVNSSEQMSETTFSDCCFSGFSAFRQINGSNVKNVKFSGMTEVANSGIGLDLRAHNGACSVDMLNASTNSEADIRLGSGHIVISGLESEGSARLMTGGAKWSSCDIDAFEWDGAPPNDAGHFVPIDVVTNLRLGGGILLSGSPGQAVEIRISNLSKQSGDATCSLDLSQCVFHFTPAPLIIDGSNNNYLSGNANLQGYLANQLNLSIDNCLGDTDGTVSTSTPWANYRGRDTWVTRQQLSQKASNGETPASNVVIYGATGDRNPVMKMTLSWLVLTAAATTQTIIVAAPFNKCKVVDAYVDVTIGFATLITPLVSVGKVVPVGGSSTTAAYITPASISSPTGTAVIGPSNRGASLVFPGDMIWGANYGGSSATQWNITVTVTAANNVNLASAGSMDLYVEFELYPGI